KGGQINAEVPVQQLDGYRELKRPVRVDRFARDQPLQYVLKRWASVGVLNLLVGVLEPQVELLLDVTQQRPALRADSAPHLIEIDCERRELCGHLRSRQMDTSSHLLAQRIPRQSSLPLRPLSTPGALASGGPSPRSPPPPPAGDARPRQKAGPGRRELTGPGP